MAVLVKTVLGNVGSKYEQLVNYIMLYDEGDECVDVTGGLNETYYDAAYSSKGTNYLRWGTSSSQSSYGWYSGHATTSLVKVEKDWLMGVHYLLNQKTSSTGTVIVGMVKNKWASGDHTKNGSTVLSDCYDLKDTTQNSLKIDSHTVGKYYVDLLKFGTTCEGSIHGFEGKFSASGTTNIDVYHWFIAKNDEWQVLCSKAGVSGTSLDTLLTDSSALTSILNNRDAVSFMVARCTGIFMVRAINSSTFLTALNSSPYKAKVQENEHWAKFLTMLA